MGKPRLDHPGDMSWRGGHGPGPVVGPCRHLDCPHNKTVVVAWGPDLRHYTLVACVVPGRCGGGCRAWVDGRGKVTTAWLRVAARTPAPAPPAEQTTPAAAPPVLPKRAPKMAAAGRVGDTDTDHPGMCLYSPNEETQPCGQPAAWHIQVHAIIGGPAVRGLVGLVSCDRHAAVARSAGRFVAEHPYSDACGKPGTRWLPDQNVCVEIR